VLRRSTTASQATAFIKDADLANRSIHANVLLKIVAVQNGDGDMAKNAEQEIKAQIEVLQDNLDLLKELKISGKISKSISEVSPTVDQYGELALKIQGSDVQVGGQVIENLGKLSTMTRQIDEAIAQASLGIAKRSQAAQAAALPLIEWLWLPMFLGVGVLLVMSLIIAIEVIRPFGFQLLDINVVDHAMLERMAKQKES
jgi:hypothetical protein